MIIDILVQAGVLAKQMQPNIQVMKKSDGTSVTNADIAVSEFLVKKLEELYPEWSVFSEENCEELPKHKKVIVVDPIDGTESYLRNEKGWGILVGFIDNQRVVEGFVSIPNENKIYFAKKGEGAFCYFIDTMEVHPVETNLSNHIKGVSSPPKNGEMEFFNNNKVNDITYLYTNSYKTMKLVEGEFDVMPNFAKKCAIWDLAAPMIVLEESGGKYIFEHELTFDYKNYTIAQRFVGINKNVQKIEFK